MTEINFNVSKDSRICLIVPDMDNKFNYYDKPTQKLHKFDEVTVSFIDEKNRIELTKDIMDVIACRFYGSLNKALSGELVLPEGIKPSNLGYTFNRVLNNLENLNLAPYWMWSSSKNVQTLLYNFSNKIYLEVVPTYPWTFLDPLPSDNYSSFDEFIENYKPYVVEIISLEVAQQWKNECRLLLEEIDSACITMF